MTDDGSHHRRHYRYTQDALGDVVFVELPEVGESFDAEDKFGVVESVKTVSDLYAPCGDLGGHTSLEDAPEMVNSDPTVTADYRISSLMHQN